MGLYDRIMRTTEDPMNAKKVATAASAASHTALEHGHPNLAVAAAATGALFAAVDTVMHQPAAAPGTYATFDTDQPTKSRLGRR
ncbi:hypothetical protein [Streptacidiphilus carbonis]|uniref:hypothetical protein n=1 Tax=Streptacidiphilus carbonis TaxID=105422 RepID=UPI0005AB027C|nr:hypothetical protein [Streptacidiphilus carbonis]